MLIESTRTMRRLIAALRRKIVNGCLMAALVTLLMVALPVAAVMAICYAMGAGLTVLLILAFDALAVNMETPHE